ncbi:uncharacterized protein NPIL_89921 [Nephila pilipes]|uniref:PKD domain-containing protein n=1 Tax=Nephila pilipes TaxID=299642 RepID=A0A8X6N0W9_NEPPI|nr:uncharacterized protein NPIL_89921 [Nephila pilipes]
MNHDSDEFRLSAGNYPVLETMEPSACQAYCNEGNFSYAAIMAEKYCLCSYTNNYYPEVDEQCCKTPPVSCGTDPDILLAMEVNEPPDITIHLSVQRKKEGVEEASKVIVEYNTAIKSNVLAKLHLFYDGEIIRDPVDVIDADIEDKFLFMNAAIPGRHIASARAVDTATGTVSVFDEQEIFIPDTKVSFDLSCPEELQTGETGICNITLYRGTDLQLRIKYGGDEAEDFTIPDAAVVPIGSPVPQFPKPSSSEATLPPEIVYISVGELPASQLVGFDYMASSSGSFEIQILAPKCSDGETFCQTCQNSCPEKGESVCSEDAETFYAYTKSCINLDDGSFCETTQYTGELTMVKSITIDVKQPGYNFQPLEEEDYSELQPGYMLALKRIDKPVVVYVGTNEETEWTEFIDTDEDGNVIDVHHFLRPVVVVPMNISFSHNFTKAGIYKVKAKMSSEPDGTKDEKEAIVVISTALSGLTLYETENCTYLDESAALEASVDEGLNVTLTWITKEAPLMMVENYTCLKEGNFTITLNASDGTISEEAYAQVCCVNHVSRNWKLESNSPQITPPGEITVKLYYIGKSTYFPLNTLGDIDFGDGETRTDVSIENEAFNMSETHVYKQEGVYNITVNVHNNFETESFSIDVLILDKLGELTVSPQYTENEGEDSKDLHGPDKTDVPVNAVVSFYCNITGTVHDYTMEIGDETLNQDDSKNVFTYKFEDVGEYSATFKASNFLEESNSVSLNIRVLSATVGLGLQASPTSILPGEEVIFTIEFESTDPFTCISFDADEGEILETFGNEETCKAMMDEEMHFNQRTGNRKRRETEEASWVDDTEIKIRYTYHQASEFHPTAKAFNTIFETDATADVAAAYPPSNIWIENNSTNNRRPMKYLREDTFRLETTAQVYDHPSRSYVMRWNVDKITPSNDVIETIDISTIRSSNCSALRFPARFLDVGLYKIEYTIDIYDLYEGKKFHVHYGVKTSAEFILPPGESEILCAVKDEIGAITELSVDTVTASLPDNDTLEEWKSSVNVEFFMVEGRMSIIAQAVASEAMVEEKEREINHVSAASEVDKVWKEYWELSGIDSSYYTKEAREEIEAQLRDQKSGAKEKEAEKNFEMLQSLEILPFEVIDDSEVYGQAVSALAETRPLNKGSKKLLTEFIEEMAESTFSAETAHPEDKTISNRLLANVMNSLSKSLSEEMIGGNFLDSELEEAYEFYMYNITEPNFFILYVNGSRWEVEEKVHMKKVEGAKNVSQEEAHGQIDLMKNVTDKMKMSIAKDLMVGENPLVISSSSGFELKVEKRHVDEISGETIENEGTSIKLPSSCILLGKSSDCRMKRAENADQSPSIGLVVVKWSNILETEGTEAVSLSSDSNTLDFSLTNRDGNSTLKMIDTAEPFEICLGISPPSDDGRGNKLRHVQPSFGGKDEFLVYHQLTIDKSGAAVKVEFIPDEKPLSFVFFYGVGYKPSLLVYDGRVFLKSLKTDGGNY